MIRSHYLKWKNSNIAFSIYTISQKSYTHSTRKNLTLQHVIKYVGDMIGKSSSDVSNVQLESVLLIQKCIKQLKNKKKEEFLLLDRCSKTITDEEFEHLQSLVARRIKGEPLAYILGHQEFWSMNFKVTKDTLIPRPDTEILIESILKLNPDKSLPLRILDLGTGSGCILLSVLSEYYNANGVGIDISKKALQIAQLNAKELGYEQRCKFYEWNIKDLKEWKKEKFDIVVSNPPYICHSEKPFMQSSVYNYEPSLALFAEENGLQIYKDIHKVYQSLLSRNGLLLLEISPFLHQKVQEIFAHKDKRLEIVNDYGQRERCLIVSSMIQSK